jgi:uncharacterized 2Fe-2S/4Fe-4S cluster protein (DUF4445 family)
MKGNTSSAVATRLLIFERSRVLLYALIQRVQRLSMSFSSQRLFKCGGRSTERPYEEKIPLG